MSIEFIKHFPYPTLRSTQLQFLKLLEQNWDKYDVFCVVAPTAAGKTAIARTIMNSLRSVSVITPTNQLVKQFIEEFPDTPTLSRMDSYWCEEWKRPCLITRKKLYQFCKKSKASPQGCPCSQELAVAKYRRGPGVYNYHTYLAQKLFRDVLVVDECLPGRTRVAISSGKTLGLGKIYQLWKSGKDVEVLSWNGTSFVSKKVTHAWKRAAKDKQMVRINTSGPTVECTDNHLVLTNTGWVEAGLITESDKIAGYTKGRSGLLIPTGHTKDVVIGSILGDGYWRKDVHTSGGKRLTIRHGFKQINYLRWKAEILGVEIKQSGASGYTNQLQYICNTKYLEDTGISTKMEAIDNLNFRSLAIWFCDDGSLSRKADGSIVGARFHTESWKEEEIKHAINWLSKKGIKSSVRSYKDNKYKFISLDTENAKKLIQHIAGYIPESMSYKVNNNVLVGSEFWNKNTYNNNVHYVVKSVEKIDKIDWVYDIEVEDTHNFLVSKNQTTKSFAVVHNCHNLIPMLKDNYSTLLWQHDYKYPSNMFSTEQVQKWLSTLDEKKLKHKKIEMLSQAVNSRKPEWVFQRSTELFNGKGTIRGEPEERDCIRLIPVDISDQPPIMWPSEVQKIILMSATISRKDIQALGLEGGKRRVCYIDCNSPIPSRSRPIVLDNVMSVNRNNMDKAALELSKYIEELAQFHTGQKGMIHATYQMASMLSRHLTGDRYLFHNRTNKQEQYRFFRDSDPSAGRILVACGLYEGVDLPEDAGRWQVISKVPWPSLASPAIAYLANKDPEWYLWECMKIVIQAAGRICRTPKDQGTTYVFDSTVNRLFTEGSHLMPAWFSDAIVGDK